LGLRKQVRRLVLDSTLNTRDLGGYMTVNGEVTNFGVVLRSDVPNELTEHDKTILEEYNIKTVIDLRGKTHFEQEINDFSKKEDVDFYNIPMLGGFKELEKINTNHNVYSYESLAELHEEALLEVFTVIANHTEGAILINCKAGKDRTGMISALLLMLCGVPEDDIIADYEISYTLNRKRFEFDEKVPRTSYYLSPPKNMRNFIEYVEKTKKGPEQFLQNLGVSKKQIVSIKKLLLQ
jgi:protein-tyrosine phosphatase